VAAQRNYCEIARCQRSCPAHTEINDRPNSLRLTDKISLPMHQKFGIGLTGPLSKCVMKLAIAEKARNQEATEGTWKP